MEGTMMYIPSDILEIILVIAHRSGVAQARCVCSEWKELFDQHASARGVQICCTGIRHCQPSGLRDEQPKLQTTLQIGPMARGDVCPIRINVTSEPFALPGGASKHAEFMVKLGAVPGSKAFEAFHLKSSKVVIRPVGQGWRYAQMSRLELERAGTYIRLVSYANHCARRPNSIRAKYFVLANAPSRGASLTAVKRAAELSARVLAAIRYLHCL